MSNLPNDDPPPDPRKVVGQVAVDVACMLLSVAAAAFVFVWVDGLLGGARLRLGLLPFVPFERAVPLAPAILVVGLGAQMRLWVRELFGVADIARDAADLAPAVERVAEEPPELAECPRCAGPIPRGRPACRACGWSDG